MNKEDITCGKEMQQNEDMVLEKDTKRFAFWILAVFTLLYFIACQKNVLAEVEWHEPSGVLQLQMCG